MASFRPLLNDDKKHDEIGLVTFRISDTNQMLNDQTDENLLM